MFPIVFAGTTGNRHIRRFRHPHPTWRASALYACRRFAR
ncbi:hypothetical protein BN2364_1211 [Alloalcanivorax xenomutans]|nr:hypothetical protein BN2364_1211 [Alloalcanivorax xenomutans]